MDTETGTRAETAARLPEHTGDAAAFAALCRPYWRALHVHSYRMLGSYDEAEDAVRETLLRGWHGRAGFDGGSPRDWLYRIATDVCLAEIMARSRRVRAAASCADVPWLQPYPDVLLDQLGDDANEAAETGVRRETIELAFLAALQVLPPRQRAALVTRDLLGWPASQTSALLGTSVAAANSAAARARALLRRQLPGRADRPPWHSDPQEQAVLRQFIDAHERCDIQAAMAIAAAGIRVTMPPRPACLDGLAAFAPLLEQALGDGRDGDWRLLATGANRMPAAAGYQRRPGDSRYRAVKLDVLRVLDGRIAEITTFGTSLFPAFGLPLALAAPADMPDERGGDAVCWLPRVCRQCGTMADTDPPAACPSCHALIPRED